MVAINRNQWSQWPGLGTLAERIGVFPASDAAIDTIEYEPAGAVAQPMAEDLNDLEAPARGGDWRKAAKKIADGLDFHLNGVSLQASQRPAS